MNGVNFLIQMKFAKAFDNVNQCTHSPDFSFANHDFVDIRIDEYFQFRSQAVILRSFVKILEKFLIVSHSVELRIHKAIIQVEERERFVFPCLQRHFGGMAFLIEQGPPVLVRLPEF